MDRINKKVLDRLPGEERTLYSVDSIKENGQEIRNNQFATNDFLNSLTSSGVPAHILKLKVGVQCTILTNLTQKYGLCKQRRVVVRSIGQRYVEVETVGEGSAR